MEKLSVKEVADAIVQITGEYTDLQITAFGELDKQLWAALHIGFMGGMKMNGYTEEELSEALEIAQDKIEEIEEEQSKKD